jgi:hypothetical protein
MRRRFLEVSGLAAVATAVVVLLKLAPIPVVGQTLAADAGAAETAGPAAKTAWGEPDLQGIWTNNYETPLQRSARYANKETLTDEERAALDRIRADIVFKDSRPHSRGSEQDVGGAYSAAIFTSHKPMGRRTSMIVDPPDGRIPPLTAEVQKRNVAIREFNLALLQATDTCKYKLPGCEGGKYGPPSPRRAESPPAYPATTHPAGGAGINRSDGPEDRGLSERCLSSRLPDFGGFRRIVQSPGRVAIFYDTGQGQGWPRIIPVTKNPHLPSNVRQWWGDSRAQWEGDTLVVDVTNFTPKTDYQGSRENLHLVERFRRIDANTLEYTVTIDDPTTWTRSWTVKQELNRQNEQANRIYYEPRCHEGNYGMPALLAGARLEEKAFAEGRGPDPATKCSGGCGGFAGGFADEGEESNPLNR